MVEDNWDEDSEPAVDTVPYIPPLASYRIKMIWGKVLQAEPHIYPEEIFDYVEAADDVPHNLLESTARRQHPFVRDKGINRADDRSD